MASRYGHHTIGSPTDAEMAEAGRQVALYVTELETRRPLTEGEDFLVRRQHTDDVTFQRLGQLTAVLEREKTPVSVLT